MYQINQHINNLNLQLDERYRGDCPVCNGKNTFTVTRTFTGILYNCYKAGCTLGGTSPTTVTVNDILNKDKTKVLKVFTLPSHVIRGRDEVILWANKYNLDPTTSILYYDVKENRIVFPVFYDTKMVDATGRALRKGHNPKWKRYGTSSYAYTVGTGTVAVLVEDCISAAVINTEEPNCTGVALMGTSLLPDHVAQLHSFSAVIVALDPDAVKKTLQFATELKGLLLHKNIFALKLEDDLKYAKERDIIRVKETVRRMQWN